MAHFTMSAEITVKLNAAIKSIQKFEKETKDTQQEFSILGRTIALDTKRMSKNLGAMTVIAGGFFAKVISQSPHLRAEFKRLEASTLLFNVALGEKLQPTVATMVDWIIVLQDKFLLLPDSIQEIILITGFLTLALTAATLAAIGLWVALGPITLAILGISLAVAFLTTHWDEFSFAVRFAFELIKITLKVFWGLLLFIGKGIGNLIKKFLVFMGTISVKIYKFIQGIIFWFGDMGRAIGDKVRAIGDEWRIMWAGAEVQWDAFIQSIWDGIHWIVDGLKGMFTSVADFFVGVWDTILSGFGSVMDTIMGTGDNEAFITRKYEEITGTTLTPEQKEEIFGAAEGRDINQDGLIFAHRDEKITTKSEARANNRGGGEGTNGNTYNYYNTYKIGSVDSKKRIREILQQVERSTKRSNDRRLKL